MRFDLFAPGLRLLNEPLHDLRVFAGVDGQHAAVQKHAVLLCYSLVLVLRVYVLENVLGGERLAVVVVALYPKPRRKVVLIIGDVYIVLAEVLLHLLCVLVPRDLNETPLVFVLALDDCLLGEFVDALGRRRRAVQILLRGIRQQFALLYCFLPLPPEVRQLVSRHHELLRRKHPSAFEVFVAGGEFGVHEVLQSVKHDYNREVGTIELNYLFICLIEQ